MGYQINSRFTKEIIQVDEQGIRRGSAFYSWSRINHCYVYTRYQPSYSIKILVIIVKKRERVELELTEYRFKKKELIAAINQYSGKQICHMTGYDVKRENAYAFFYILIAILFLLILFLLSYPS